jgi:hypothetical protein
MESCEIIIVAVKHDRRDPGYWRHSGVGEGGLAAELIWSAAVL